LLGDNSNKLFLISLLKPKQNLKFTGIYALGRGEAPISFLGFPLHHLLFFSAAAILSALFRAPLCAILGAFLRTLFSARLVALLSRVCARLVADFRAHLLALFRALARVGALARSSARTTLAALAALSGDCARVGAHLRTFLCALGEAQLCALVNAFLLSAGADDLGIGHFLKNIFRISMNIYRFCGGGNN
jgi:hypothetical protein